MKTLPSRFTLAAMFCISLLFSCTTDLDPPPSPISSSSANEIGGLSSSSLPAGMVLCLYSGGCIPIAPETCSLIGQAVQSCPAPPTLSSSSSLPTGTVLCLYSGGCVPIAPETCSLIGQAVQSCPTPPTLSSSSSLPTNMVLCLYSGGCIPIATETCALIGQTVQSCPTPPTSSSSSSLPTNTVLCLYSGGCIPIAPETCSLIGQAVQSCPAPSSSSGSGSQTPTSSSSLPTNTVLCLYSGGCIPIAPETCSLIGQAVQSCPVSSSSNGGVSPTPTLSSSSLGTITPGTSGPVSYYGELKASGNKLIGSKTGTAVQVRGVSLYWSNTGWGGEKFFTAATVNAMVDDWKAEIIRVPIGYSENGGYSTDPSNLTRVKTAIDAAIAKGVYVIIDWHSHNAHNELSAANSFFSSMAQTYGSRDNVIFEIYNEPTPTNGGTWANIKTYASSVISTIRQYSDNLILVGTPSWDQDVDVAASSPISASNIAYVFHFYAVSHTRAVFEPNVTAVLSAGYPVFVSEYGTVTADGDGAHSAANTDAWHTYMDNNKISSCAWNLSDKKESSAFFGTGSTFNMSGWTNTSYMTASGQYIFNKLRTYANSATWRGGSVTTPSSSSAIIPSSSSNTIVGTTYYCDYGPKHTCPSCSGGVGGGCFEMESRYDDCDPEYGKVVTSCSTNGLVCDWGPRYYDPYLEDCGEDYCGGCYQIGSTLTEYSCERDFGVVRSSCPAASLATTR